MRAIVITGPGGPEVLRVRELPDPVPAEDEVLIRVEAFGVNHAETHMRKGEWPEATTVSGIECAGTVAADPSGRLAEGMTVVALMGGMGRTRNGSYAEYVAAPEANVVPVRTSLGWADLAAIPESYATAWSALTGNLELMPGQSLLVRGATSALGQAAVNIASDAGATVLATTRRADRAEPLRSLGARHVVIDGVQIAACARAGYTITSDAWYPIASQSGPLVSRGQATVPDLCGGGQARLRQRRHLHRHLRALAPVPAAWQPPGLTDGAVVRRTRSSGRPGRR